MKQDLLLICKEEKLVEDIYKEVYFDKYCESCKHKELPEKNDPCHECLNNPVNLYSHKPVNWKEKEK
jgi:hypothetical protein